MTFDYEQLEKELANACDEVHKDFLVKFSNSVYISAGGAKLEAFISELQKEFENTAEDFLKRTGNEKNTHFKRRALAITKLYAKKCIDDFSKVDRNTATQ